MDSRFNYRHTQVHRADLSHRAELHRLAEQAHQTKHEGRPERLSLLAAPSLAERVHGLMARLRHHGATRPNPS